MKLSINFQGNNYAEVDIVPPGVTLGTAPHNAVVLQDDTDSIALVQVAIRVMPQGITLKNIGDLEIEVNFLPVVKGQEVSLHGGDQIQIADYNCVCSESNNRNIKKPQTTYPSPNAHLKQDSHYRRRERVTQGPGGSTVMPMGGTGISHPRQTPPINQNQMGGMGGAYYPGTFPQQTPNNMGYGQNNPMFGQSQVNNPYPQHQFNPNNQGMPYPNMPSGMPSMGRGQNTQGRYPQPSFPQQQNYPGPGQNLNPNQFNQNIPNQLRPQMSPYGGLGDTNNPQFQGGLTGTQETGRSSGGRRRERAPSGMSGPTVLPMGARAGQVGIDAPSRGSNRRRERISSGRESGPTVLPMGAKPGVPPQVKLNTQTPQAPQYQNQSLGAPQVPIYPYQQQEFVAQAHAYETPVHAPQEFIQVPVQPVVQSPEPISTNVEQSSPVLAQMDQDAPIPSPVEETNLIPAEGVEVPIPEVSVQAPKPNAPTEETSAISEETGEPDNQVEIVDAVQEAQALPETQVQSTDSVVSTVMPPETDINAVAATQVAPTVKSPIAPQAQPLEINEPVAAAEMNADDPLGLDDLIPSGVETAALPQNQVPQAPVQAEMPPPVVDQTYMDPNFAMAQGQQPQNMIVNTGQPIPEPAKIDPKELMKDFDSASRNLDSLSLDDLSLDDLFDDGDTSDDPFSMFKQPAQNQNRANQGMGGYGQNQNYSQQSGYYQQQGGSGRTGIMPDQNYDPRMGGGAPNLGHMGQQQVDSRYLNDLFRDEEDSQQYQYDDTQHPFAYHTQGDNKSHDPMEGISASSVIEMELDPLREVRSDGTEQYTHHIFSNDTPSTLNESQNPAKPTISEDEELFALLDSLNKE